MSALGHKRTWRQVSAMSALLPKSGVDFRNARTARSRSLWHDDVADVASLALTGSQRRNRPRRPSRELRDQGCQRCAVGTRKPVSSGCRNWFCRSSFRICHMRPSMTPKASAASKVTRLQTITMISVPLPRGAGRHLAVPRVTNLLLRAGATRYADATSLTTAMSQRSQSRRCAGWSTSQPRKPFQLFKLG